MNLKHYDVRHSIRGLQVRDARGSCVTNDAYHIDPRLHTEGRLHIAYRTAGKRLTHLRRPHPNSLTQFARTKAIFLQRISLTRRPLDENPDL